MNRELIFSSLLTALAGSGPFKASSRRYEHWSKATEQPKIYVIEGPNAAQHYPEAEDTRPREIMLEAEVIIYSNAGQNPDIPPAQELNSLIDDVETALKPAQPRQPQTFGIPSVISIRIQGRVEVDPGHLGGQAMAVIPVLIKVAEFQ